MKKNIIFISFLVLIGCEKISQKENKNTYDVLTILYEDIVVRKMKTTAFHPKPPRQNTNVDSLLKVDKLISKDTIKKIKYLYILIGILITSSCKSQSPIIDIENYTFSTSIENAYYKDVNNYFNGFEGTWLYTSANTIFKIILKKREQTYTGKFYKDALVGEYQYIENGVEKINTLSNINALSNKPSLWGAILLKNTYKPKCNDCLPNERRLSITLWDYPRKLSGKLILKKTIINNKTVLEGHLIGNSSKLIRDLFELNPPQEEELTIPFGKFIFYKQ